MTIVAPDQAARNRAHMLASLTNSKLPPAYIVKRRTNGIFHSGLVGEVSPRVVIVDDIIDSGRTLVSACSLLREHGVREIAVVVTHGLFTNGAWKRMFGLGVTKLYVTDSCPEAAQQKHPGVRVIPLAPLVPAILPQLTRKEKHYENAII
jgi:ribose-phosphate pyrophosphokinase